MSEPFVARSIEGALKRAADDKQFAVKLFKNPEAFQKEYNLSDRDVKAIRESVPPRVKEAMSDDYE